MPRWTFMLWTVLAGVIPVTAATAKQPHWAFQPLTDPPPPPVSNTAWCRTSIDRFILAALEARGLRPAPPAEPRVLLRRATFGLTGLPPRAAALDAFEADPSPDAWMRAIEQLLASHDYGEHWGRHWLDVVRYADTAGETADYPVPEARHYRDYVIRAFNDDLPYDRFLREQIAGDILARDEANPARHADAITATGYIALSRRFGFDSENYHHLTVQDTLDTLGQSILGLTLGCARCHAHKYDPVSMRDYYALYGIFESTRYAFPGSEQKQRYRALVPASLESSPATWRAFETQVARLTATIAAANEPAPSAILRSLNDLDGDFEMQAPAAGGSKGVLVPPWVYEGPIAVAQDAQSPFRHLYPLGKVGASIPPGTLAYRMGQAFEPPDSPHLSVNLDFRTASHDTATPGLHRFWLGSRNAEPAVELLIGRDSLAVRTGDRTDPIRTFPVGTWINVQLGINTSDGTVAGNVTLPGDSVAFPPRPMAMRGAVGMDYLGLDSAGTTNLPLPGLAVDNFGVQSELLGPATTNAPQPLAALSPGEARAQLERCLAEGPAPLRYAVREGTPRDARIHRRGDPDRPGDEVPRGLLEVLGGGPLPPGTRGSGRRELAEWLTRADHPLTARVMVNRIWQYHFGEGLVATANDFGTRGRRPSHPELLDHLAGVFIRSGWSVKAMHRLILGSAAYQQRSRETTEPASPLPPPPTGECPVVDTPSPGIAPSSTPMENLFSPFPRRRLDAEEIRDTILVVSDALDRRNPGAHPFPAPTSWGFTQHGPFTAVYEHNARSVYLMRQRIKRHPFLALFDGPDPNASTANRPPTTVPTQALFFLNAPFVHAAASNLTTQVLSHGDSTPTRIRAAYRFVLRRDPTPEESSDAADFLSSHRTPETPGAPTGADRPAFEALARVLLASNEFITVD